MTESIPLPVEPDRVCTKCGALKPADAFAWKSADRRQRRAMCRKCRNLANPRGARKTPETRRAEKLKELYGITVEQWDLMYAAQDGLCAMCRQTPEGKRRLSVDHCHTTGKVRALLCAGCNIKVGAFEGSRAQVEEFLARYGRGNPVLSP